MAKRSVDKTSYARPPRLVWASHRNQDLDKDGMFWIPGVGLVIAIGDVVVKCNQRDWQVPGSGHLAIMDRSHLRAMLGVRRVDVTSHKRYPRRRRDAES